MLFAFRIGLAGPEQALAVAPTGSLGKLYLRVKPTKPNARSEKSARAFELLDAQEEVVDADDLGRAAVPSVRLPWAGEWPACCARLTARALDAATGAATAAGAEEVIAPFHSAACCRASGAVQRKRGSRAALVSSSRRRGAKRGAS